MGASGEKEGAAAAEANFFIAAKLRIFTYFSCLSTRLAAFSLPAALAFRASPYQVRRGRLGL